jgi:hypothetical protein
LDHAILEEPLSDNTNKVEVHGCIVCGRLYNLLVVYTPAGKLVGYTVTGSGGHPLPGADRPLVACDVHSAAETDAALARHATGRVEDPDED